MWFAVTAQTRLNRREYLSMRTRWIAATVGRRGAAWLALCALPLCALTAATAQANPVPDAPGGAQLRPRIGRLPDKPSIAPSLSIPVEPLGFTAPGPIYLGQSCLASLDFLDENRLLFTFRVPGLIRRQFTAGDGSDAEERHIRAVVLALPAGNVQAEALWTLHDRERYLWMLKDGQFLLRDRDELRRGDATLELKPYLRFPGPVTWLAMDPAQQFLVTDSREPAAAAPRSGDVGSPSSAAATVTTHDPPGGVQPASVPDMVLRILERESGKVMLVSRVRSEVHLPINSEGYIEALRGKGMGWVMNFNYFSGGSAVLGEVDSFCAPSYEFIAQRELLFTTCNRSGDGRLVAMTTDGRRLWEDGTSSLAVWPVLVRAPDGSRLARESLAVAHPVNNYAPLDTDEVKGQLVEVFDAANGNLELSAQASPVLDAGGNAAISPSGRRVAILNAGAIQIFDLPPAPAISPPATAQPRR
jgi:hypothetical protein